MRSFRISTERIGPRRWWLVVIHDTLTELQDAAHRYRPEMGRDWWTDCYGCCHPTTRQAHTAADGTVTYSEPVSGYAGMIRYTTEQLTDELVTHELMHAAVATYRMNVCADVRLGRGCGQREESLAYIYGELYASLLRHLTPAPEAHGNTE